MKKFLLTLALVLSMSSAGLWAVDGNELYRWGQATARIIDKRGNLEDISDSDKYDSYVQGVADVLVWQKIIVVPTNTTIQQVLEVVLKFLADNPSLRQYGAVSLVSRALTTTYGHGPNWKKFVEMVP